METVIKVGAFCFSVAIFSWIVVCFVALRGRRKRARHRRRERLMQSIINDKPKCYGDFTKAGKGPCPRCVVNTSCQKVANNMYLIFLKYGQPLQYNYPEMKERYDQC